MTRIVKGEFIDMTENVQNIDINDLVGLPDEELVNMYWDKKGYSKEDRDRVGDELVRRGYVSMADIKNLDDSVLHDIEANVRSAVGGTERDKFVLTSKLLCSYGFFATEIKNRESSSKENKLLNQIRELNGEIQRLQEQIKKMEVSSVQVIPLVKGFTAQGNRHSLTIAPETWTRFSELTDGDLIDKGLLVTLALDRLMNDIESGRIQFMLNLRSKKM